MNRTSLLVAMVPALVLAGCSAPIDYDKASPEEQRAFLEDFSQGMYDGLKKTLPHGKGGVYAAMGKRNVYPERKLIEISVDIRGGEENISVSTADKEKMTATMCEEYQGSPAEQNDITTAIRYNLPGGGTAMSFRLNRDRCSRYQQSA